MPSATQKPAPKTAPAALTIAIFVIVMILGLALVLYAGGTNTGFVYGNV